MTRFTPGMASWPWASGPPMWRWAATAPGAAWRSRYCRSSSRGERPAALALLSPWADLTLSGKTLRSHDPLDALIPVERLAEVVALYTGAADPRDPRASPIHGDFPDPPPTLIQVGTREALRSDAEAIAEWLNECGGRVSLEVWPHAPHLWHVLDGLVPEAREAITFLAKSLQTSFDSASR